MTTVSSVLKKAGSSILSGGKVSKIGGGTFAIDTAMNLQGGDDVGTSVAKASVTGMMGHLIRGYSLWGLV